MTKDASKQGEMKYPHAANLFRFCRRVLDQKYGGGVRVIDQDVGQLLGLDPADCSHWKKGKKNIRSIQHMKSISQSLGVDEKLVVEVATGELNDVEAYFECSGYGAGLDANFVENAKKAYFRQRPQAWSKERELELKDRLTPRYAAIREAVQGLHQKINFSEPPLYLPEIAAVYPELRLMARDEETGEGAVQVGTVGRDKKLQISYVRGTEMKPYVRYSIAKAMAMVFINFRSSGEDALRDFENAVYEVESHYFASLLLMPSGLISKEMESFSTGKDVLSQLAESFWVSKGFVNRRLRDVLRGELQKV